MSDAFGYQPQAFQYVAPQKWTPSQREYFAAAALQGLIASRIIWADAERVAVEMADNLIYQLSKPQEPSDAA